ncbi:hypothetical protein [Nonomuraea wenchangensis]|uniref:Peptidase n=1 Tax=Nonomuraea wenchangensis TaxID=568860 RepID=A0A1I0LVN5_9ACTN|nr:hypothetical protein [Nonomuraea wenchangensis]SEU46710.1 hypothetical protein SAMN05421811_127127 [Nonomuraea wenchangensis]
MEPSHAESYAQLVRDRVAEIPVPEQFRDPDVLVAGDGIAITVARPTPDRPRPVLTVGQRMAIEAPRDVIKGIVAVEVASASLADAPGQRARERAGWWAPTLAKVSIAAFVLGMLAGSPWLMFSGGIALIGVFFGWRERLIGAAAFRERVHAADELATEWVGRQSVHDALTWYAERAGEEPPAGFLAAQVAAPLLRQRITRLAS